MTEKPKFKQINIKLSDKDLHDLDLLSNALGGVSKPNLIRLAVAEFIHRNKTLINDGNDG
jgi:hypothetical protein